MKDNSTNETTNGSVNSGIGFLPMIKKNKKTAAVIAVIVVVMIIAAALLF